MKTIINKLPYDIKVWDEYAKTHQGSLNAVKFAKEKGCPGCKYKPESWNDFEFHMSSTHGISSDKLLGVINKYNGI